MKYEVEQKYRVRDLREVTAAAHQMGAKFHEPVRQEDRYFSHPARDFAATDEALRLRRDGETNRVTYKGPKADPTIKTRQEIELPLPAGDHYLDEFSVLLSALSFQLVAQVSKRRTTAELQWQDQTVTVCLDQVDQVGDFVEIELVVDSDETAHAKEVVLSLAGELGLTEGVRTSYLELLLDSRVP